MAKAETQTINASEVGTVGAAPAVSTALSQVSKITLTTFAPKRIGGAAETVRSMLLGTLIGRATDFVSRKSPDGTSEFTGLAGAFEARLTANLDGSPNQGLSSGVLFLPPTFQDALQNILSDEVNEQGEVTREGAKAVAFAFEVHVQRAGNAAGYEWILKPLFDNRAEGAIDPLAEMRRLLPPAALAPVLIAAPTPAA